MGIKKIPMRSCVVTKEKCPKAELIRIVRTPEGNIIIDLKGKQNGHGAYLKKDLAVIDQAEKTKALNRYLETEVPSQIFEELRMIVSTK